MHFKLLTYSWTPHFGSSALFSYSQIKVFQIIWCSFFNDVFFVSFESILYEGISPNSSINWLIQCIEHFVSFPCIKVHFEVGIVASALNVHSRRPVLSANQAIPSCFYFRISWMEQHCFYFFCPLWFLRGLRSLKHWLLQKLSMKNLDQKFKFLIKK